MTNLWFRENRKGIALYTNLFEHVLDDDQFTQWDQELNQSQWPHRFLIFDREAAKNDLTSTKFSKEGDFFFQQKEWRKAMELYNRSLCFAQTDQKKMSTLYTKRGVCFFNMEMYKSSLVDIELALSTDQTIEVAAMLHEYRNKCTQLIRGKIKRRPTIPALSFVADEKFPCMANVLEFKNDPENPTRSSYFVAKTDINIDQVVLSEEAFTSIAVGYDRMFCFTCLATCKNFVPCMKCTDVMFCDVDCMNRDKIHQITCGAVYHRMPSYIKFVIQSILVAITSFPTIDDLMKFVKATVSRQNPNMEARTDSKVSNYLVFLSLPQSSKDDLPLLLVYKVYTTLMKMSFIKSSFNTNSKQRFLMHLVGHHVLVLASNSEGGFEKDQNQFISAAMTNVASMFEHSCMPNLLKLSIHNRTILITIQPIKAGDRLSIDYWPEENGAEMDAAERCKLLRKNFGIYCRCEKCRPSRPLIGSKVCEDPSFFFVKNYQKFYGNQTSLLLKKKCAKCLENYTDGSWNIERDIVTKIYTQCVLDELQHKSNWN